MKLQELLKNIQPVQIIGDAEVEVSGINIDSRKIKEGHLFVAMKGTQVDGHKFIPKAIELGAKSVLCEDRIFTLKAVYFANGIVTVPNVNYYYFDNPKSTVNNRKVQHFKKLRTDKNDANKEVLYFLRDNNVRVRDKNFWAVTKEFKFFDVPLIKIKESLRTKKIYLFGFIPVFKSEVRI